MTITYKEDNLAEVANQILQSNPEKIITFTGDMGVGKTTLIKEICAQLGVKNPTSSPTFSLVNEYNAENSLIYHFDCYRLKSINEAFDMGIVEYLDSKYWCFIEWPEIIQNLLPTKHTSIKIELIDAKTRTLTSTNA